MILDLKQIKAHPTFADIRPLIAEVERLQRAVEASKDCDYPEDEPCPYPNRECEACEYNVYPDDVRKALETAP